MQIILTISVIYVIQMMVACLFNILNGIEVPTSNREFILMTFLPYTMIKAWDEMRANEKYDEELLDNIW